MRFAPNNMRWYARWLIKWVIFGLAYGVVCFPHPTLLVRHLQHWSNPEALIEPNAPQLEPFVKELRSQIGNGPPDRATLAAVEKFVYRKIPYAWDWNTWGMADYLPTVAEVIGKGREDCDGRAVLAGSLLTRLGVPARLVTDFTHVWIDTDLGATMGPRAHKAIEVTNHGMKLNAGGLAELPRAVAFGVSVFPLTREVILVVVLWLLLLDRRVGRLTALVSLTLLFAGLLAIRFGAQNPNLATTWTTLLGTAVMLGAIALPFVFVRSCTDGGTTDRPSPADGSAPDSSL